MHFKHAIQERRAYRSLEPVEITEELIKELAASASLAPSCSNNQPWRYVFAYDSDVLEKLHTSLARGNAWAEDGSMIVAVFSKPEYDCIVREREYYLFDTGMATAFLILKATVLGLVAHPIAGYNEEKVKKTLKIPEEMRLITLIIVGKHSESIKPVLSNKQRRDEQKRPKRLPLEKFVYLNRYSESP